MKVTLLMEDRLSRADVEMMTSYFHHKGLFQVMSCDPKRPILIIVLFSQFVCRMIYCHVAIQLLPLLITCCVVIAIVYVLHTLGLPMAVLLPTLLLKTTAS